MYDIGIVARRDLVKPERRRLLVKFAELDVGITMHTGVRRQAILVISDEGVDDILAKVAFHLERIKGNSHAAR